MPSLRAAKEKAAREERPIFLVVVGDDSESAFEGEFQAVLSYRLDAPQVQSVRAVVEGVYHYRLRGTSPQKLRAAIESRPE